MPSINKQGVLVSELFAYMEEDEYFKESFTILLLNDLMDAIADITKEIDKNHIQCSIDNSERKDKKDGVRDAAYRDMRTLINTINSAYENNQEDKEKTDELRSVMWQINESFKKYRTPMKGLATKRKNKRIKEAEMGLMDVQKEIQNTPPDDVDELSGDSSISIYEDSEMSGSKKSESNTSKSDDNDAKDIKPDRKNNPRNSSTNPQNDEKKEED